MANKINRIYIGAICNRDLEIFEKIKKFCSKNYNISIINLLKKGSNSFSIKYLKKQFNKYPISFIIVKLHSEEVNQEIYKALDNIVPQVPRLNSLKAVNICESRRETFRFVEQNSKKLNVPKTYYSLKEAYNDSSNGTKVVVKLDTHNIPDLPKDDRIIGIAESKNSFKNLINGINTESLFFQEYLGGSDLVYKIYVIDRYVVAITSHNKLYQKENLTPLELIHIRVPIDKQLKRRILRLGRKMGMSIFGIDYILNKDGIPYIVDINDFPSFRNIPEAISLISDYIYNMVLLRQQYYKLPAKVKG